MSCRRYHSNSSAPGQSMVEFALVGPLFLIVIFVILEGGLLMNAQTTLDNAAREGAREAVVCPRDQDQGFPPGDCGDAIASAVKNHLGILDVNKMATVVCAPDSTASDYLQQCASVAANPTCQASLVIFTGVTSGSPVEVDVYYEFDYFLGDLIGPGGPSTCLASRARLTAP